MQKTANEHIAVYIGSVVKKKDFCKPAAFSCAVLCIIVFTLATIIGAVGLFRSHMPLITWFGNDLILLRDSFCLSTVSLSRQRGDMFPVVLCHAFCMSIG